jgi:hypothetical protein
LKKIELMCVSGGFPLNFMTKLKDLSHLFYSFMKIVKLESTYLFLSGVVKVESV